MREVIRDSGRLEHILIAFGNVQKFLERKTIEDPCHDKIILCCKKECPHDSLEIILA